MVAQELITRDEFLRQLSYNLKRAQQRMPKAANKHRRDVEFQVRDPVFLKIRPHSQASVNPTIHAKLAARYYGPFQKVAYRLKLQEEARIRPVFHVS